MNKLVKSLLLAAPATVLAAAAGQAADLPANKSAPVEYVRVCDVYGSGFFYIPGTDTCLQVGGYVRFEMQYTPGKNIINVANGTVSQYAGAQDWTGMEVRGRVDLDARTQTQWGTVQSVIHLRGTNTDGIRNISGTTNFGAAYTPSGNGSSTLTMERAYIRFAGLTAGVSSENFSTMPAYMYGANLYAGFPNGIKQLAYTFTFGGGFSATLAAESKGDLNYDSVSGTIPAPSAVPTAIGVEYNNQWDSGYVLVGNARYDSSWGYVQINGAVTENTVNGTTLNSTYSPLNTPTGFGAWAAGMSFRYNVPFISPGDQFHFQFAYAHGINGLIMSSGTSTYSDASAKRMLGGVMFDESNMVATHVTPTGAITSLGTTDAYGVYGMFTHYWAPTWRTNVQVGYAQYFLPTAYANGAGAGLNTQLGNADLLSAGGNLIWSPTKNFDIGIELDYAHATNHIQNPSVAYVAAGEPGLDNNNWATHIRLERQF